MEYSEFSVFFIKNFHVFKNNNLDVIKLLRKKTKVIQLKVIKKSR